ncbi:MAG: DUF2867 domain-containing protein [Planctomycetia bacterium]|nr:DUF2867 domain-containing protein [Planctomycetia bacterium]
MAARRRALGSSITGTWWSPSPPSGPSRRSSGSAVRTVGTPGLEPGEKLDCWHVELCDRPRRLRLAAEMRMPGRGWLEFEVVPRDGDVTIHQTAIFDPRGLGGLAYWYSIWPLHELVFRRMLAGIARAAVQAR